MVSSPSSLFASIFGEGTIPDVWTARVALATAVVGFLIGVVTVIYKVVQVHSLIEEVQRSAHVSEKQLVNNSGSSVKDAIDRIEDRIDRLTDRIEIQFDASADRQARMTQRITKVESTLKAGEAALRAVEECTKKHAEKPADSG